MDVLVAKQAAEVDVLSGGRLRLGIGVGWNPVEFTALGEDFGNRGRRIEEQVEVLRLLWTENPIEFHGKWHHIALVAKDGGGQTAYVDGEKVGTHAYDHSDFDWQKRVWVGFSNDAAVDYFEGMIDEIAYLDIPLSKNDLPALMQPLAVEMNNKLPTFWSEIKKDY